MAPTTAFARRSFQSGNGLIETFAFLSECVEDLIEIQSSLLAVAASLQVFPNACKLIPAYTSWLSPFMGAEQKPSSSAPAAATIAYPQ